MLGANINNQNKKGWSWKNSLKYYRQPDIQPVIHFNEVLFKGGPVFIYNL